MSKPASDATTIKNLRRELREEQKSHRETIRDLAEFKARSAHYESKAKEWENRFDVLLRRLGNDSGE